MKLLIPLLAWGSISTLSAIVSDSDLACSAQAWGGPQRDHSVEKGSLSVGGQVFTHGIGTHAISEIPLSVPPGTVRFTGGVGIDDEVGEGKGSTVFRILSGESVLWESPVMKAGMKAVTFDVAVPSTRHRKLYLQADPLEHNEYDHADWLELRWTQGDAPAVEPTRVMHGREFGLKPGSHDDQSAALRRAITALRAAPGSTLKLEKGIYHFRREQALRRHFHVSNHDQPLWHPVSIPLVDLRDVTIDAGGSTFLFHGQVLPVLIQDSSKVTLRGLAIDFVRPHHSQGVIARIESGHYELAIDPEEYPHELRNAWFVHKGEGWEASAEAHGIVFDGRTREIVAGASDFHLQGMAAELGRGRYRIEKDLTGTRVKVGDVITMRHSGRPHPGMVLYRAKNTVIEDVTIHQSAGMALLAQRSENIRMSGGGVFPREGRGRFFTSNADATHFSNCRGRVVVENALFEGMMDDAINVHATCLRIREMPVPDTLVCQYVHPQAVGFETLLPGEALRFIAAKHLTPGETRRVKSVRKLSTTELEISLDGPVPEGIAPGDAVENANWFPAVVFRGNTVRNNRARGSLFTTPEPVLIEDNTFQNSSGSAILLAGDANGWYESGACRDVIIRNTRFHNNLTSRYQFTEALISIYPEVPDLAGQSEFYHRNIRVEDNTFETFDVPLLFAISTKGLVFRNNKVTYNRDYPAWNKPPFKLRRCADVRIENNRVIDAPGGLWSADSVSRELTPQSEVTVK